VQSPLNTDQQLLAAMAAGERGATEQVYHQNFKIVSGWLIKNGGDRTDAADLFQEAMVVLYGKSQDVDFQLTCSISTYLLAICKHLWYKKQQRRSKDPVQLTDNETNDDDDNPQRYEHDLDAHMERENHYNQLDAALEEIGEPCRSILKAFYHQDKSMQEIAATFGYTNPDNAKTQKYKCLSRLKKIFYATKAQ